LWPEIPALRRQGLMSVTQCELYIERPCLQKNKTTKSKTVQLKRKEEKHLAI
jgi:hypothetical protein